MGLDSLYVAASYEGLAKSLVAQLKFQGNQSAAWQMAGLMLSGLKLPHAALLTHIPATTQHIRQRGYDQAELLTRQIARQTNCQRLALLTRHGQKHQLGARREERLVQLQQALRVKNQTVLAGRHIILIDDVLTTGSTLRAATYLLQAAGAKRVDSLIFAQA